MHDRIYSVIWSNGKNTTWPWWENSIVPHAKCHPISHLYIEKNWSQEENPPYLSNMSNLYGNKKWVNWIFTNEIRVFILGRVLFQRTFFSEHKSEDNNRQQRRVRIINIENTSISTIPVYKWQIDNQIEAVRLFASSIMSYNLLSSIKW
jgi:hypothetical protein